MEELGGKKEFVDRFVAQHIAFFYYWNAIMIAYILFFATAQQHLAFFI
jgi:hypothetical protein